MGKKYKPQAMMNRVVYALTPLLILAIGFFGWRCLALFAVVSLVGAGTEYFMAKRRNDPMTGSCFVTCALFTLSLPPTIPFWIAGVGIFMGIFVGKEVFGGFGRNPFNPAIVGRAFIYVCFPGPMTNHFAPAWEKLTGFLHWGVQSTVQGIDAVTTATPMFANRNHGFTSGISNLLLGNTNEVFKDGDGIDRVLAAGSMGEVSAVLILICGLYLVKTKTANWRLVVSPIIGAISAVLIFRHICGIEAVPNTLWTITSGGFLFASFFMTTDPVSGPKHKTSQWLYGFFVGFMIVFLRWKSSFIGGVAFAILLGNTIAPTFDLIFKARDKRIKAKKALEAK